MKGFEPCPTFAEWTAARKVFELPEEHNHNGRSEGQHPEEMSVLSVGAPVPQVTTCCPTVHGSNTRLGLLTSIMHLTPGCGC